MKNEIPLKFDVYEVAAKFIKFIFAKKNIFITTTSAHFYLAKIVHHLLFYYIS